MISLKKDFKHGTVSLKVTLADDLWYLTHLIEPGNEMTMKTERKLKLGGSDTNAKVVRKKMVLTLKIESVELADANELRVKGIVLKGPEEVPHGSYHTFGISVNDSFTLRKELWPMYLIEKLNEALANSSQSVIIVQYDREHALFSMVRQTGIEHLAEIKVAVAKKQYEQSSNESLYGQILQKVTDYRTQHKITGIVFASADFWKKYVQEKLSPELKKQAIFISTPEVSFASVNRLLTRPELHQLLANQRLQKEESLVGEILKKLDEDLLAYGFNDVARAAQSGAIEKLGVSESFLLKKKEEKSYESLDELLKLVDASKGKVLFLHAESTTKTIDGLGGIVGVLRWKTN
ncbi:hypothetical protein K9M74_02250 [Candidatus Woesearchaeota archaeon]|nr:hypothetical protein [Candidatus Woesearchaeota archaeon]